MLIGRKVIEHGHSVLKGVLLRQLLDNTLQVRGGGPPDHWGLVVAEFGKVAEKERKKKEKDIYFEERKMKK